MRHLLYILVAMAVMCGAVACGKKHSPNSVKAQVQVVDAVARLVAVDSTDTMAMQSELLKAEAIRSQFLLDGDSVAAQDFDETFRETLIQKSPRMAKTLFSKKVALIGLVYWVARLGNRIEPKDTLDKYL